MKHLIILSLFVVLFSTSPAQKGFITNSHLKLYYELTGKGPTVLFLHGGYLDHTLWNKQVSYFSKNYSVLTIDLPGHGQTFVTDTTILIADVIRTCLDSLHIVKASVIGLSLGAACAVDFAIAYPARVNKLVLASPGLSGGPEVLKMDRISLHAFNLSDSMWAAIDTTKFAEVFADNWYVGPFRKRSGVPAATWDFIFKKVLFTVTHHTTDAWPNFQKAPRAAHQISHIQNKLLMILGDKDLPYIDSACHFYSQQIINTRLVIFHNAAHMVNLEQGDKFDEVVGKFLRVP